MLTREPPRVPKPASKNPWYVLATIHGEQTEEGWNEEIAAKNRRIWNGWSCGRLPRPKPAELAKLAKLDEAGLEAWSETERAEVEKVFATGRGMGLTAHQLLWRVELPLALPTIMAGIRVATVSAVALTTVGAILDYGGLGDLLIAGKSSDFKAQVLVTSALCVLLAVVLDLLLVAVQRVLTPWTRKASTA